MFFVKSHFKSNFSIVIEMVQSIHIQYMTKYFIKFCNYLNVFRYIFTMWYIMTTFILSQIFTLFIKHQ